MPNTGQAIGLAFVFVYVVLFVVALTTHGMPRVWAAAGAIVLWILTTTAFVALLGIEGPGQRSDPYCPGATSESYGGAPSHWQWVPVGKVCEYPEGDVGPTNWRVPVEFALLAFLPVGMAALALEDWR